MSITADTFTAAGAVNLDAPPLTEGMYALLEAVRYGLVPVSDLTDDQRAALEFALPDLAEAKFDPHQRRDADGRWTRDGGGGAELAALAWTPKDAGSNYVPSMPNSGTWPKAMQDAYSSVVTSPGTAFAPHDIGASTRLTLAAHRFAVASGVSDQAPTTVTRSSITRSPAEIYADGIVKRAYTERLNAAYPLAVENRRDYLAGVDGIRRDAAVMIATTPASANSILTDSKRFKTQFETGISGGALNPDGRAVSEVQQFNHAPNVPPEKRTVYGYMALPGTQVQSSVDMYGTVRWTLKDAVRDRATMTVGDSLSTGAIPIPLTGQISDEQKTKARALPIGFLGEDSGVALAWATEQGGVEDWMEQDYAEAQIEGGVSLDDVAEIHVSSMRGQPDPFNLNWQTFFDKHAATLNARGITVFEDGVPLTLGGAKHDSAGVGEVKRYPAEEGSDDQEVAP